ETLLVAEDRGDLLHDQLNAPGNAANVGLLDSVWAYDVVDFDRKPTRFIALGRDSLSAPSGGEDNEPTGLHISNGSASMFNVLGTRKPTLPDGLSSAWRDDRGKKSDDGDDHDDDHGFRWFVTEQHGMNQLFEILARGDRHEGDR